MSAKPLAPALCLFLLLLFAGSTSARAESGSAGPAASVLIAEKVSWFGFVKYWKNWGYRADRVVLIVALIGGLAFLIIAFGGKWRR